MVRRGGWQGFLSRKCLGFTWRQKDRASNCHASYVTPANFYTCSGEEFSPGQGLFDVIFNKMMKIVQLQDAQTSSVLPS